jgi:hypothetical protein
MSKRTAMSVLRARRLVDDSYAAVRAVIHFLAFLAVTVSQVVRVLLVKLHKSFMKLYGENNLGFETLTFSGSVLPLVNSVLNKVNESSSDNPIPFKNNEN